MTLPVAPSCAQMMAKAVAGYSAVMDGMLTGQKVVEVQFGDQKVKYESTQSQADLLRKHIIRLHQTCPTVSSAAILGLGGAGSLGVRTGGCVTQKCC